MDVLVDYHIYVRNVHVCSMSTVGHHVRLGERHFSVF